MRQVSAEDILALECPQTLVTVNVYKPDGSATATTVGWAMIASGSPFYYAVALGKKRYALECLLARKEYVVSFPGDGQEKAVLFCGTHSGRKTDKEKESGFRFVRGAEVNAPLIEGAAANLECRLIHAYDAGDHTIIVGEVVTGHVEDTVLRLFNFGNTGFSPAKPLKVRT